MHEVLKNRKTEIEQELIVMLIGGDNKQDTQARKKHILKHITPEMFDEVLHQNIVKMSNKLVKNDYPITLDYFFSKAKKLKTLYLIERAVQLQELNEEFVTNSNCDYYIKLLHELYFDDKFSTNRSYEEFKQLEALKKKVELKNNVYKISHNADRIIADYYNNWEKAVLSGWNSLDKRIGAYLPGDFGILAGAPGMGKSCTMLNIIQQMDKRGTRVLLFSLEMQLQQLQNRLISSLAQVQSSKIRLFNMTSEEVKRYIHYSDSEELTKSNLIVCDDFKMNLDDIYNTIQSQAPDIVFVDYLGLVTPTVKGGEYEQMNEISRGLKVMAGELRVPIIALHQLGRQIFNRENKEPTLADLRGSGHLEQDADFVFFVHRPAYFEPAKYSSRTMKFIIAKSRHTGGNKYFTLDYDAKTQTITDPDKTTPFIQTTLDRQGETEC